MRHLVWHGPGRLAWEEAEDPRPERDAAVVRPLAVARCDLDPLMATQGLFPGPYVDLDADRCAQAERLGAAATHHQGPWPRRFDRAPITVDNTGDVEGLACTIRSTDDYGTCTPVSIHFTETTSVPLLEMYTKGITLEVGRADSRRHLASVLELAAAGRFDPRDVDTTVVPFADAAEAWLAPATKLVLHG